MLRKTALAALLTLTVASVAFALTPAGRWQGVFITLDGIWSVRYHLDVKGDTLTGSMEMLEIGAEFPIVRGTAKGDSVDFTVLFGGSFPIPARGNVVGDTLYLWANLGPLGGETNSRFVRAP
jgi:hypothetical protein